MLRSALTTASLALAVATLTALPASAAHDDGRAGVDPAARAAVQAHPAARLAAQERVQESRQRGRNPWPVSRRTATITFHNQAQDPEPSRQIEKASVKQDLVHGTFGATVLLEAAPTAETTSLISVSFGTTGDGLCNATAMSSVVFSSTGPANVPHLRRDGRRLVLTGFKAKPARTGAFDCAFVQTSTEDYATVYDTVIDYLRDHRDRAVLKVSAPSTSLRKGQWKKVNVKVTNSRRSFVSAHGIKMTWKTSGVRVKGSHQLRGLAPGQTRKVAVRVQLTGNRSGAVKFTARSLDVSDSSLSRLRRR